MITTKHRSNATEWMDDMTVSGSELYTTLDQIAHLNQWLGGNKISLQGVLTLIEAHEGSKPIHIIDLGCGNGDMLRMLSNFGKRNGIQLELTGIDANESTIEYAIQKSADFPNIRYKTMNFFSEEFNLETYDIALATLVFHHFQFDEIRQLLGQLIKTARLGIVVNDLQRSVWAYYLFRMISIFVKSKKAKQDGLISILRGFKKQELIQLSKQLNINGTIHWKWAFRYQWIIKI